MFVLKEIASIFRRVWLVVGVEKKQQLTGLFDTKDTLTPDTVAENSPSGQNMDVFLSLFPNFRVPWKEFLSLSFSNKSI